MRAFLPPVILLWALCCCPGVVPAQGRMLTVNGSDFKGLDKFDTYFDLATDPDDSLPVTAAKNLDFKPFTGNFYLKKNEVYWFRTTILNQGPDSLKALFCFTMFNGADLFFETAPSHWERLKGGTYTNYSDRSFPPSRSCHPILLQEGQQQTYYLRVFEYFHLGPSKTGFRLLTFDQEKTLRLEALIQNSGKQMFKGIFFGILALFFFFSLVQFYFQRQKAYLFYTGYTASLFLFFMRSIELNPPLPFLRDLKAYHPNFEAPLGYLCYIFYLLFIRSFLDLPNQYAALDRFFRVGIAFFIVLLVVDVSVFQVFWGWRGSLEVHFYASLLFFVLSLWTVFAIIFRLKSRLANYILTGTVLLLLPAIFTVYADHTPGAYQELWGNTARAFTPAGSSVTFYMYDMRVGLLLEMCCFLLGLSYKTNLENKRVKALVANAQPSPLPPAEPTMPPAAEPTLLQQVEQVIQENLSDEEFNVEKLARKMAMSRTKLFRLLQLEQANASPHPVHALANGPKTARNLRHDPVPNRPGGRIQIGGSVVQGI